MTKPFAEQMELGLRAIRRDEGEEALSGTVLRRSTSSARSGKAKAMLIERAREERTPRARRGGSSAAAVILLAAAGLVGCGASQAERTGSRAPVAGATAEEATEGLEQGKASYYSDKLAGHRTANGEPYEPSALTAAHRTLPFGAIVAVTRPDGRHVNVRINDRGPHKRGRVIDLSRRAAEQIGLVREGVGEVSLRVVSLPRAKQAR